MARVAAFLLASLALAASDVTMQFQLTEVTREIDLTGRYAKVLSTLTLRNIGTAEASKFYFALPANKYEALAHFRAHLEEESVNLFDYEEATELSTKKLRMLKVKMMRGVKPGEEVTVVVHEALAQQLEPYPAQIGIFDQQYLRFKDDIYMLSPYTIDNLLTKIFFPSSEIESYTMPSDSSYDLKGKVLTYGPYQNISPFSSLPMEVHFEHSAPLPYFTKVERRIEVSHWGNVAIDEFYSLVNDGAVLKGEFDRLDYNNRYRASAMNALERLEAVLPRSAWGLYYRDEIGNVSTSAARREANNVNLEVQPRFPLLGGWKSNWNIGYNVPIRQLVKTNGHQYVLNTTFGFPFKDIIAEELEVKIILPEGATDLEWRLPFPIDSSSTDLWFSYLDTTGRPTIILKKKNAVDFHRKPFLVLYKFDSYHMMREPLMLTGYVAAVLLVLVFYFRMDMHFASARKGTKIKSE